MSANPPSNPNPPTPQPAASTATATPQPASASQPAAASTPPPVTVRRFIAPFPGIERKEIEPFTYLKKWGQSARDGFFPLGINGQWHGGIHFSNDYGSTGGHFLQGEGVRCIADGEIVAYRYDLELPQSEYDEGSKLAKYSTSFVLVRHPLQLPQELMQPSGSTPAATTPSTTTPAATPAAAPAATPSAPATPPSLALYSLYMHLLHAKAYQDDEKVPRPFFWPSGPERRKVGTKAKDKRPKWKDVAGLDKLSEQGLNVRKTNNDGTVNRQVVFGWLPRDVQLTLQPGTGQWRTPSSIDQGALVRNPSEGDLPLDQLRVFDPELDKLSELPKLPDTNVVVPLEKPIPVAAGAIIGHMGNYQRYIEAANNQTSPRPLLHLELFADSSKVEKFIQDCRQYAKNAPPNAKTLLKIDQGATLVQPATGDVWLKSDEAGNVTEAVMPVGGGSEKGGWVRLKRGTLEIRDRDKCGKYDGDKTQSYDKGKLLLYAAVHSKNDNDIIAINQFLKLSKEEQKNYPRRCVFVDSGQVIWGRRRTYEDYLSRRQNDNLNKIVRPDSSSIPFWSAFPLKTNQYPNKASNSTERIVRLKDLDPENSATDDKGTRWWEVLHATDDGRSIMGWACETGHDKVELVSPWAWPGFVVVEGDTTAPTDYLDMSHIEKAYQPKNPMLRELFKTIDTNNNGVLCLDEIKAAWQDPLLVHALSRKIVKHKSEWGQPYLSEMRQLYQKLIAMKPPANSSINYKKVNEEELKRIEKTQFFSQIKGKPGFPQEDVLAHLHPLAVIENFVAMVRSFPGWKLGQTSERYESAGNGPGTVSTGIGDHGGVSYGTYQLMSRGGETSTLAAFIRWSSYGNQFEGLTINSDEFKNKWKEIAANDREGFGDSQHEFIKKSHHDPAMSALKNAGYDFYDKGPGVLDMVWSTSVQFGASGARKLILAALSGMNIQTATDADIIRAVQGYKAEKNDVLFASSSENMRAGTLKRAGSERDALLKLDATY